MPVTRITSGLINDTFALGDDFVLQRLNDIFRPEVNIDIEALTHHLRAAGVPVPRLSPCALGTTWVHVQGPPPLAGTWRVMTRIHGATHNRLTSTEMARSAGSMLGRFHGAMLDVDHTFAFSRPGAHDTSAHMSHLERVLESHTGHRLRDDVAALADALLEAWSRWGVPPELPSRICHGDPKVSNLIFDSSGEVAGVIDLDTMAWMSLDIELGDAMRSWCNTGSENTRAPSFDTKIFANAMAGYLGQTHNWITAQEVAAVVPGTQRICLELAARFAADALTESYFGWDPAVAPTRGEHNLLRAQGQLALAMDVGQKTDALRSAFETSPAGISI
jgi:Ser/Thr protein kinase RdoA (MazF antagonist)